jgi:hypothetical protein
LKALQIDRTYLRLIGFSATSLLVKVASLLGRKSLQNGRFAALSGRGILARIRHNHGKA